MNMTDLEVPPAGEPIEGAIRHSDEFVAIYKAIVEFQGEVETLEKSDTVDFGEGKKNRNYRYVSHDKAVTDIRACLRKHGLGFIHGPKVEYVEVAIPVWEMDQGKATDNAIGETKIRVAKVTVETRLIHVSGQWLENSVTLGTGDTSPQGVSATMTYCRRYGAFLLAGLVAVEDDDDANGASGRRPETITRGQRPAPTRQPVETTSHGTKTTPAGTTGNPKQVYAKWRMDCLTAAQGRKWVNADVALTKIIDGVTNSRNLGSAESWPDNLRSGFLDQIKAGALDTTALRAVTPAAPSIRTLDAGEGPESDNSEGS